MLNENITNRHYSPVCFLETCNEKNQIGKDLFIPEFLTAFQNNLIKSALTEQFSENTTFWNTIKPDYNANLKIYFNSELNKAYPGHDEHTARLKEMVQRIADLDSISVMSIMIR